MIKGKGKLNKIAGNIVSPELNQALEALPDNAAYLFVITDEGKNRNLPYINYFFSVVLKYLSDALPEHPSTSALYRYFEAMFAPVHSAKINNKWFQYRNLKTEKTSDFNDIVEKVVEYALNVWGIEIPRREDLKDPRMPEF